MAVGKGSNGTGAVLLLSGVHHDNVSQAGGQVAKIEAVSLICAQAASGSSVLLQNVRSKNMPDRVLHRQKAA